MNFAARHTSLEELYTQLLRKQREHQKLIESGQAKCLHCSQQKSAHCHDGRCTIYATSREFRYEQQPDVDRIARAIGLIEELIEL